MTGDQKQLGGLNAKLLLDIGVGLARGLMVLHAVRAKAPLEKTGDPAMFKLTGLYLQQIIREGEQPETSITKLA